MSENKHSSMHTQRYPRRRAPGMIQRTLADLQDVDDVQLEQAVRELNCFESLDVRGQKSYRKCAIEYLEELLQRWCRSVEETRRAQENVPPASSKKSFAEAVGAPRPNVWQRPPPSVVGADKVSPTAALIPFGSYRLGVHSTISDLDVLALAPPYVYRSDFFTSLVKLLQKDENCHQIHPIPTAYTPVIKFALKCNNGKLLQVDLVFARVTDAAKLIQYHRRKSKNEDAEYHLDDSDLQDLDEAGVRSLNGARVSQMILEAVPDVAKFQTVLRAVKHWAVVQGIYSNVLGFLGGVNWALLTAWVCKHYPKASASATLCLFLREFAKWKWNAPVLLGDTINDTPPITNVSRQTRALSLPAWNPQTDPRDGLHVMPIITPAYPSMNSSYNVDYPQLRRIQDEMVRASNLLRRRNSVQGNPFSKLFDRSDFFDRHKHFVQVTVAASNEQDFVEWFRLVESKLRVLISSLETQVLHVWPFARCFTKPNKSGNRLEKTVFIGLRFAPGVNKLDVRPFSMGFLHMVNNWEQRTADMELFVTHIYDNQVPSYVLDSFGGHETNEEEDNITENTAPATDDEDEPVLKTTRSLDLTSPTKKCRVNQQTG